MPAKTIDVDTIPKTDSAFTEDEITRYASYHWLIEGDVAHVWRTISGETKYMGTTEQISQGETPSEQLPLLLVSQHTTPR